MWAPSGQLLDGVAATDSLKLDTSAQSVAPRRHTPTRDGKMKLDATAAELVEGGSGRVAVVAAVLLGLGQYISAYARLQLIEALREHYESDVQVRSIRVSLLPPFRGTLVDLEFRHHGRRDVPPLITIRRASASMGIFGLFQSPKRVRELRVEGLQIHVPPRDEDRPESDRDRERSRAAHW